MSVFIDIIGAFIAGSLVVLTIIFSIMNIQQINYNTQAFLALNLTANNFIEVVDMAYLEPVSMNIRGSETSILAATRNRLTYQNRRTSTAPLVTYILETQTDAEGNIFFRVTENGITVFNSNPVFFESADVFTFFNAQSIEIADPATQLDDIHSVRVDLVFVTNAWSNRTDTIRYPITFWRFFKNIYLI